LTPKIINVEGARIAAAAAADLVAAPTPAAGLPPALPAAPAPVASQPASATSAAPLAAGCAASALGLPDTRCTGANAVRR
jgi:hypothetical protein